MFPQTTGHRVCLAARMPDEKGMMYNHPEVEHEVYREYISTPGWLWGHVCSVPCFVLSLFGSRHEA